MIYKILSQHEWDHAQQSGVFKGSGIDIQDGFIHFSASSQLAETAAKHFGGQKNLVLLAVDEETLGSDLKWEVSRGGDLFPHLYANLELSTIHGSYPLPLDQNGRHVFPDVVLNS